MIVTAVSVFLVVTVGLYIFLIAPGRGAGKARDTHFNRHYAHRGLHTKDRAVPENSITAMIAARDAGYGMELDLSLTRDGQVVVFHDNNLRRVCGVDRELGEITFEQLCTHRLFDTGESAPLFSEVLQAVNGRVPLIVELKDTPRRDELCRKAAALLDTYTGRYSVESFHPGIVGWFYRNRPGVIRGQLSAGPGIFVKQNRLEKFLIAAMLTNVATRPHFVAYRHQDSHGNAGLWLFRRLGGAIVGWTVTDTDDLDWCLQFFDAIIFEFIRP
jgi:glycerophosphoryl diester phosphodiesterase